MCCPKYDCFRMIYTQNGNLNISRLYPLTSLRSATAQQKAEGIGLRQQLPQQPGFCLLVVAQRSSSKHEVLQCNLAGIAGKLKAVLLYELSWLHATFRP